MSTGFADPAEVEAAFYRAFQELNTALMERVWSEGSKTACVHPGGDLLRGKPAVLQSWTELFASAERPSILYRTLQITNAADIAIHLVEEMIRPGMGSDTAATRVLATNIYRHGAHGWHMTTHHASLPIMGSSRKKRQGPLH